MGTKDKVRPQNLIQLLRQNNHEAETVLIKILSLSSMLDNSKAHTTNKGACSLDGWGKGQGESFLMVSLINGHMTSLTFHENQPILLWVMNKTRIPPEIFQHQRVMLTFCIQSLLDFPLNLS